MSDCDFLNCYLFCIYFFIDKPNMVGRFYRTLYVVNFFIPVAYYIWKNIGVIEKKTNNRVLQQNVRRVFKVNVGLLHS